MECFRVLIQISTKFIPGGANDDKSGLIQVMTGWGIGDKWFYQPMITQSNNINARLQASVCQNYTSLYVE